MRTASKPCLLAIPRARPFLCGHTPGLRPLTQNLQEEKHKRRSSCRTRPFLVPNIRTLEVVMQRVERSVFGELNGKPIHCSVCPTPTAWWPSSSNSAAASRPCASPDSQGLGVAFCDAFEGPTMSIPGSAPSSAAPPAASPARGSRSTARPIICPPAAPPAATCTAASWASTAAYGPAKPTNATGATLKLTYLSPDGEEGYPGNASVTVTYRLDDDNRFHMNWEAVTDAPTIIDMSSRVH